MYCSCHCRSRLILTMYCSCHCKVEVDIDHVLYLPLQSQGWYWPCIVAVTVGRGWYWPCIVAATAATAICIESGFCIKSHHGDCTVTEKNAEKIAEISDFEVTTWSTVDRDGHVCPPHGQGQSKNSTRRPFVYTTTAQLKWRQTYFLIFWRWPKYQLYFSSEVERLLQIEAKAWRGTFSRTRGRMSV